MASSLLFETLEGRYLMSAAAELAPATAVQSAGAEVSCPLSTLPKLEVGLWQRGVDMPRSILDDWAKDQALHPDISPIILDFVDVNDNGQGVGTVFWYWKSGRSTECVEHVVVYVGEQIIDLGGEETFSHYNPFPLAISNDGTVFGTFYDVQAGSRCNTFVWKDGVMTWLDQKQGWAHCWLTDTNESGMMTGMFVDADGTRGVFVWKDGQVMAFPGIRADYWDCGDAKGMNINNSGLVAGTCFLGDSDDLGIFVIKDGQLKMLDVRVRTGCDDGIPNGWIGVYAVDDDGTVKATIQLDGPESGLGDEYDYIYNVTWKDGRMTITPDAGTPPWGYWRVYPDVTTTDARLDALSDGNEECGEPNLQPADVNLDMGSPTQLPVDDLILTHRPVAVDSSIQDSTTVGQATWPIAIRAEIVTDILAELRLTGMIIRS